MSIILQRRQGFPDTMQLGIWILCFSALTAQPIMAQDTDQIVWEADWDAEITIDFENGDPFEEPGVVFPGFTFEDTMHTIGLAWQANTVQEVIGLACINYGPLLLALDLVDAKGEEDIKETCDHILFSLKNGLQSDIYSRCLDFWDENIPDIGYNENSTVIELTECYTTDDHEESPGTLQSASKILESVYSSCQGYGLGTNRISSIAIGVLDWLGPSVLSFVLDDQIDPYIAPYMGCTTLRYILSMEINDMKNEIVQLAAYPVADALEHLRDLQICNKLGNNEDHREGFNFIMDMLLALSRRSQSSLCTFFEGSLTRSDFMEEASTIANNFYAIVEDKTICSDVMTVLASTEAVQYIDAITGRNLTVSANINLLCDDIVDTITNGPSTTPGTYSLPNNVDINEYGFFSNPGELLPDFFFTDALKVAGAVLSAGTVAQAGKEFCDVFENFVVDNDVLEEVDVDVAEVCELLGNNDLENIEQICLEEIASPGYGYPLSLRRIDPSMVGANTGRKLLGAESFSDVDVCSALDTFFHSNNNLRSIASFALSDYTREALPIAHGICENWNEVMCYLNPYCSTPGSTGDQDQQDFDAVVKDMEGLLLTALGYKTRTTLCKDIADGIDDDSGRAKDDTVQDMVSKILSILDDTSLCRELLDESITVVAEQMETDDDGDSPQEIMYQVTGLNKTLEMCEIVAENFPSLGNLSAEFSFLVTMLGLILTLWTNI
ncbi:hypothetical protein HOLleu_28567 [Holothuria leucospilota]|uniref:Uncharacterized protein n=1 Tax=Holothuria leucospilota TaxID=206669 RepID=A0A9Q1BML1_HOLLE|nr:hypothetical protein HOLleu_28567 [Holothuria leucospilota]